MTALITLLVIVAARVLWQWKPGIHMCALFWFVFAVCQAVTWDPMFSEYVAMVGASMNAVVTLANGGFMPFTGTGEGFSLWRPVRTLAEPKLEWMCDRLPLGMSWGDVLIFTGIGLSVGGVA